MALSSLPKDDRPDIGRDVDRRDVENPDAKDNQRASGSPNIPGVADPFGPANPSNLQNKEQSPEAAPEADEIPYSDDGGKNTGKPKKKRGRFTVQRAAVGGGITGAILAAVMGGLSIYQGPLQLTHLAQLLHIPGFGNEQDSGIQTGRLIRAARSGQYGETRVGKVGSIMVNGGCIGTKCTPGIVNQLKDIGIEFKTGSISQVNRGTVDTAKLKKVFPELDGKGRAEALKILQERIPELKGITINNLGGSDVKGWKFTFDARNVDLGQVASIVKRSVGFLHDGKVATAIDARVLKIFYGLKGLWNPGTKKTQELKNKYANKVERRARIKEQANALKPAETSKYAAAKKNLKDKVSGNEAKLSGALLITAGACLVRSIAGDIVVANRGAVAVPAVIGVANKEAWGSKVQTGDAHSEEAGAQAESLIDDNGNSVFQAQALKALYDPTTKEGVDIEPEYKQAFSKDTTEADINNTLGLGGVGAALCSPGGQILQIGASLALIVAGPFSGGATWASLGAKIAATSAAISFIHDRVVDIARDDVVIPKPLAGPVGGNILAYGSRELYNTTCRASGCVELSNSDSAAIDRRQLIASRQEFRNKPLLAQVFDTSDYRTPASRFTDSLSPDPTQNLSHVASSLLNIGGIFSHAFASLIPSAKAADKPYDWGFPKYGIPQQITDDPALQDPYDNADKVAAILDSGDQTYVNKARTCFGVEISKGADGWFVTAVEETNPNEATYIDAHCNDLSDSNWSRMILFVFDSRTMDAMDCFIGDTPSSDESCQIVGASDAGSPSSTDSQSNPNPPSGDAQKVAQQILDQAKAGKVKFNVLDPTDTTDGSSPEDNIGDTAAGQPAKTSSRCPPDGTTNLDIKLLQFLYELSQETTYQINELSGGCHSPDSNHYKGIAVDFGCPFDAAAADKVGKKYNISDGTGETCATKPPHYHYSIGGN
jgi:hypothetical protein